MLYKLTVTPYSSFSEDIQSDTLFGAFCWSYKYLYGELKLEEFIQKCMLGKPPIIFSNMFEYEKLPMPLLSRYKINKEDCSLEDFTRLKKVKSKTLISKKNFLEIANNNYENIEKSASISKIYIQTQVHNMVGRSANTVNKDEDGAGNLFSVKSHFGRKFDIYILCDESIKEYENVLELMFKLGIGARKSTGSGAFKVLEYAEETELTKNIENANAFVAISNFIPSEGDSTAGHYKLITKFPKLDREFASTNAPFKKPVVMIQAGSCFYYNTKKEYYGSCIDKISSFNEKIMINACTIALPIILDENCS